MSHPVSSAARPQKTAARPPSTRDVGLDFVRGIAVLLVLDFHNDGLLSTHLHWLGLPRFGGTMGVAIFFVLSGFLVGGLLLREWDERGGIEAFHFLARRSFKLWPQYYAFLLLGMVTGHRTLADTTGNLLHLQNYLGGIKHTWSLAVEEHAYLLMVALLWLAARRGVPKRWVFWGTLALWAAITAGRAVAIAHGTIVFAQTQYRADGIVLGLLVAAGAQGWPRAYTALKRQRLLWFGLLVASVAMERFVGFEQPLQQGGFDVANLTGLSLLMLFSHATGRVRHNVAVLAVARVGWFSYGIYLWHVSVVAPMRLLGAHVPLQVPAWVASLLFSVGGIALGVGTTQLIELPTLRLRDWLLPKRTHSRLEVGVEEVSRIPLIQEGRGLVMADLMR